MTLDVSTGDESSVPPVSGFIGLNTLRRKAALIYSYAESQSQLRVLPSMKFSCNGTINSWTFVAQRQNGNQYPRFQFWRPNGTSTYLKVYESIPDIVVDIQQQIILDSLSQNMSHLLLYRFKLAMYWECTNLAIVETAD